jgi:transposase-like protein
VQYQDSMKPKPYCVRCCILKDEVVEATKIVSEIVTGEQIWLCKECAEVYNNEIQSINEFFEEEDDV